MSRSPRRTPIQASSATMTASRPTQPAGDSLAPLPKDITLDMVRQWFTTAQSERGVRWPILLDECLAPVVTACNDEKRALAVEQAIADEMQAIRRSIQAIRSATDVLLTELPVVRGVYTNWPSHVRKRPTVDDDLALVDRVQEDLRQLRSLLEASRPPGGQTKPALRFAYRIAVHMKHVLEQVGAEAAVKAVSPLTHFLHSVLSAVYGNPPSQDAIASAIKRRYEVR